MPAALYKKLTKSQNYLHANSAHPLTLKKSIPYSQALRIKLVCSTLDEYKKHSNELVNRFVEEGYQDKHHLKPNWKSRQSGEIHSVKWN